MVENSTKSDQLLAQLEAFGALEDGQVDLLVDYLNGDGPISPALRRHLAAMLQEDGDTTYRFLIKGRRRGELGWTDELARNDHKMNVGMFMERRVRAYGEGGYESALEDTKRQFSIEKTTAGTAHKHVKDILEKYNNRDMWEHLNERYPEPKDLRHGVQRVTKSE